MSRADDHRGKEVAAWTSTDRDDTGLARRPPPGEAFPTPVANENAAVDDAAYIRALAHPLRLRILAMLEERPGSPARLAEVLGSNAKVVDYHVKRLVSFGLADLLETRRSRGGTEHIYAARPHPTFSDAAWEALDAGVRATHVVAGLRQTSEYVNRSALAGGFDRGDAHLSRTPLRVDEEGWTALAAAAKDHLQRVAAIEQQVHARGSSERFDAGVVVLVFEALPFSGA